MTSGNFMDDLLDYLESTTPQERIRAARAADPGYIEPVTTDWRDQTVAEVGELGEAERDRGEDRGDPG